MTRYTVFVAIEVECNDQPPADVRARLANVKNRVGQWIKWAARDATIEAIGVFSPETYFPNWPEGGKTAEIVGVSQHVRRTD